MIHSWEIVKDVLNKYRGLPVKLAAMNGKSHQYYSSHGIEPRTVNPLSSGNVSDVEHFMRFARKYDAGAKGAGLMLIRRVAAALEAEFCDDHECVDQVALEVGVVDEVSDVQRWLIKHDIPTAEPRDLVLFINDCKEAVDLIQTAQATATARLKYARTDRTRSLSPRAEQVKR